MENPAIRPINQATNYKALADKIDTQWVKYPHTEEETQAIQAGLSKQVMEKDSLEVQLKEVTAEFKPKIDRAKKAISNSIQRLRRGYEEEELEVYGIADHEKGTMAFYDAEGNEVSSRRLLPDERQLTLRSNF